MRIIRGFPEPLRQSAATIYFEAFEQKIGWLLSGKENAIAYIADVMDPNYALCAISGKNGNQKLVGLAGFKTSQGCLVGGGFAGLTASFGFFPSLWRAPIFALLDRDVESGVLLMDGIVVTPGQRGKGTGSKLLDAITEHAKNSGKQYVRLDVIDKNIRARTLYERKGFRAKSVDQLGVLKHLFGFSSSTQMILRV